jgi:hypothetical protein
VRPHLTIHHYHLASLHAVLVARDPVVALALAQTKGEEQGHAAQEREPADAVVGEGELIDARWAHYAQSAAAGVRIAAADVPRSDPAGSERVGVRERCVVRNFLRADGVARLIYEK